MSREWGMGMGTGTGMGMLASSYFSIPRMIPTPLTEEQILIT